MITRLLLGPQRPTRNLGEAVDAAGIPNEAVAVISAGWQEAEGDTDDVKELVQRPLVDLQLYQLRLRRLMMAAREILRAVGDKELIAAELRHAISQLRALDRHHLHRVQTLYAEFESMYSVQQSEILAAHAADIRQLLAQVPTLLITGGNVIVLVNRMRLFGVHRMLDNHHLIAWSAGAMALSDLIVLYHDRAPQGRRDPEVLGPGCGVLPGYVFFPDASRRLKLKDSVRVDILGRRFSPGICVTLDSGSQLTFSDNRIQAARGARQLGRGGRLTRMRVA